MKRFFVVEENDAPGNNAIYFMDCLSRSILTGVARTNSVSGEGKKNPMSFSVLNRVENNKDVLLSLIDIDRKCS